MPGIPREYCLTDQARQLWDECAASEAAEAGLRQALDAIRAIAYDRCVTLPPPTQRGPTLEAGVMVSAAAARARCYRRGMSDEARRRTVALARSIGALPSSFDESALPWRSPPQGVVEDRKPTLAIREHAEARTIPPPDLLALRPDAFPADARFFIADRLARISFRNGTGSEPRPTYLVPGGLVNYADGSPAVLDQDWCYGRNDPARQGWRFFRPGRGGVFLNIAVPGQLEAYEHSVLAKAVSVFGEATAAAASAGVRRLVADRRVLALIELDVECGRAERASMIADQPGVGSPARTVVRQRGVTPKTTSQPRPKKRRKTSASSKRAKH